MNFKVLAIEATSIIFQWNILRDQEANGIVRQYVIICSDTNTDTMVSNDRIQLL